MSNQRTNPIPQKKNTKLLTNTPSNLSPTISPKNSKLKKMYCDIFPGQLSTTTLENSQKVWGLGYHLYTQVTKKSKFLENQNEELFTFDTEFISSKIDEKLEFWMYIFEHIPEKFKDICEFGVSDEDSIFLRKVYHSGIIYLLLRNPTYLSSTFKTIEETLKKELESDRFWNYNPLKLVSLLLWCRTVHTKTIHLIQEKPNITFDEIIENLPFHDLPFIEEEDICEQDLAIDYVDNLLSSRENVFVDLLHLVSASILNSTYEIEDQFSLDN